MRAPGSFDIIVDVNRNGLYDDGIDPIDSNVVSVAGFFVIPVYWMGTIVGVLGHLGTLGIFYVFRRGKKKQST